MNQVDLEAPLTADEEASIRSKLRIGGDEWGGYLTVFDQRRLLATLDRERSARASLIAELRAGVLGLPTWAEEEWRRDELGESEHFDIETVDKASVLRLLDMADGKEEVG